MKRAVLPLAAVVALSLPGAAEARISTLKGELDEGGRVAFELKRKADGTRKVLHWRWRNLPITCDNGNHRHDGEFLNGALAVSPDRSFFGRRYYQGVLLNFAEVKGSFPSDSWKRASGTFQVSGETSLGTNCESGVVGWTAKKR